MDFNCGIYAIISPSGKRYIGQASNIRKRWDQHRCELRYGNHHCRPLQRAYEKYGENSLVFVKIAFVTRDQLTTREQEQIDSFPKNMLYNVSLIAQKSTLGRKHTAESIAKMVSAYKNANIDHKARGRKISAAKKGKYAGEKSPAFGLKRSESARLKMSLAKLGRPSHRWRAPILCVETGRQFELLKDAVSWLRENGRPTACYNSISAVCNGREKSAYGYRWKYADQPCMTVTPDALQAK
jgi:group I intron endonuclease